MGFEILLIGRQMKKSLEVNNPYKTIRFHLFFNQGFLFYTEYSLRLFFKLLFTRKELLYANDLDTLLPNFLVSKLSSCKLIYDSHEYFTEVPELITRPGTRSFWLKLEEFIFPKLKNVITVNQKLAEIYSLRYKVPVTAIKNVPKTTLTKEFKPIGFLKKDRKIIVYQGALNMGRGLELMIDAMAHLKNHQLILAGDGDIMDQLKSRVALNHLYDRVIFPGKLKPFELRNLTIQADIGLSLEEDMGLNYRYCLPNKVFDYIHAGIPVLVSELPLLEELLTAYKIGEILKKRNPKSLATAIEKIIVNKSDYLQELERATAELNWEKEKKLLMEIIKKIE
jgi:glycosyltransferase involved in cell wall biosynthesis